MKTCGQPSSSMYSCCISRHPQEPNMTGYAGYGSLLTREHRKITDFVFKLIKTGVWSYLDDSYVEHIFEK